jgi:hypothetical protein
VARVLTAEIPPNGNYPVSDPNDAWSFDDPFGNLLTGSTFLTTPKTVSTAPMIGNTVSGWGAQVSGTTPTSGTAVLSIVPRADGMGNCERLTVTNLVGTDTALSLGIGQTVPVPGSYTIPGTSTITAVVNVGDTLQGGASFNVAAGQVGLKSVGNRISENDGNTAFDVYDGAPSGIAGWPTVALNNFVTGAITFPIRPQGGRRQPADRLPHGVDLGHHGAGRR